MNSIINLNPSPRALHFAAIKPRMKAIFFLVGGLLLLLFNLALFNSIIRQSELWDGGSLILFIIFLITNMILLGSAFERFKEAKQLTDMLKPSNIPEVKINKEIKMIHFINYPGKSNSYEYDLIVGAKVVEPSNKREKKYSFRNIDFKYMVFEPSEDDINIKSITFEHLENADELASLITQGELTVHQIRERLLAQG